MSSFMCWPLLNVYWENSEFGRGGFNFGGGFVKMGKGLHVYLSLCLSRDIVLVAVPECPTLV